MVLQLLGSICADEEVSVLVFIGRAVDVGQKDFTLALRDREEVARRWLFVLCSRLDLLLLFRRIITGRRLLGATANLYLMASALQLFLELPIHLLNLILHDLAFFAELAHLGPVLEHELPLTLYGASHALLPCLKCGRSVGQTIVTRSSGLGVITKLLLHGFLAIA